MSRILLSATAFIVALCACRQSSAADAPPKYFVEYPTANQFTPPVDGFFEEISSAIGRVGRRTFRHQLNGGYGLPVVDRVGDAHLLHLGADVGWYRVGDPVVSVADGVVRIAQKPIPKPAKDSKAHAKKQPQVLQWGGVVAIEHQLANKTYVTTVYGHLDPNLQVSIGDVVKAGQPIGTIGNTRVNGGYKPHLHFGVRRGRAAEPGRELVMLNVNGRATMLKIREVAVKDDLLRMDGAQSLPAPVRLTLNAETFELRRNGDAVEIDAAILWKIQPASFAIVGYGLTTDGWLDPVEFLKDPDVAKE